jgi:Xaa-Pro aminopeptidase
MSQLGIDVWMTFAREGSDATNISLIAGSEHVVQNAALLITAGGQTIAILEPIDVQNGVGVHFDEVIEYENDISGPLRNVWQRLSPARVALNYSRLNFAADGLTHGMFLRLVDALGDLGLAERMVSSEELVVALRSVKSDEERARIKKAAEILVRLGREMTDLIKPGATDTELAAFVSNRGMALGASYAYTTIRVNRLGETTKGPSNRQIEPGHVVVADMAAKFKGYAADLKRLWYVDDGNARLREQLRRQWNACTDSLRAALALLRPGTPGYVVHEKAWAALEAHGFRRSQHSYGHQVGRDVHDAGPWLGDRANPYRPAEGLLQAGMVVTLDPTINMSGVSEPTWWCMGTECMAEVTPTGGQLLHEAQEEVMTVSF